MVDSLEYVETRAMVAKFTIRIMGRIARNYFGTDKLASVAADVLLCSAVFIGQAEGRPMSATNLAGYIGMPRPTVVRRLRQLSDEGLIEFVDGRATIPLDRGNSAEMLASHRMTAQEVRTLLDSLSAIPSNLEHLRFDSEK